MTQVLVVKRALLHEIGIETHKISSSDTPNQILLRGKVLGNHLFETLEHFFVKLMSIMRLTGCPEWPWTEEGKKKISSGIQIPSPSAA